MDDLDPSFRVWVLAKRQTIHERLMRSLDEGMTSASVPADSKKRIAAAIVNLDPTHEYACRYLMRAHAEEGDIAGALRIYKALWDLLDRDYGMEPSPATEELVANIKLGILERGPADRERPAANDEFAVRMVRETALQPAAQKSASVNSSARTRLVLRPFAMHGVDEIWNRVAKAASHELSGGTEVRIAPLFDDVKTEVYVTFDGQMGRELQRGEEIVISRAERRLNLVRASGRSYYDVLQQKLKWGLK